MSWVDLPVISGFAFFIRRDLWNELGGFDMNLPDYGNEAELCKRLSGRGFRLVWTQNSYIHHFGHGSYYKITSTVAMIAKRRAAQAYIDKKMNTEVE
jgi:GT2 family glycosyltransferase